LVELLPADYGTRRVAGALGELTDYSVETRYPDLGEIEPTAEDAQRAVTQALAVQQAMRRDLEAHGYPFQQRQPQQSPQQEGGRDTAAATTTCTIGEGARIGWDADARAACRPPSAVRRRSVHGLRPAAQRRSRARPRPQLGVPRSIRENCTLRPACVVPTQLRRGRIGVIVGAGRRTIRA